MFGQRCWVVNFTVQKPKFCDPIWWWVTNSLFTLLWPPLGGLPDMMSASEGGHGKADIAREVAWILYYKSDPNADKGEGVEESENFAGTMSGSSFLGRSVPCKCVGFTVVATATNGESRCLSVAPGAGITANCICQVPRFSSQLKVKLRAIS